MKNDNTTDYLAAFVIGTLLGAGAALLLAPEPPTRREKLMKELEPYRKRLRKQGRHARKRVGEQASAAADYGEDLVAAGRSVASDLRDEVASMVAEAREEIAAAVENQLATAQKSLRKRAKRLRS